MEDSFEGNDPTYRTYFTMNWDTVLQSQTEDVCVSCGRSMLKVESVKNDAGMEYEGRVCHSCKALFWVRKDV